MSGRATTEYLAPVAVDNSPESTATANFEACGLRGRCSSTALLLAHFAAGFQRTCAVVVVLIWERRTVRSCLSGLVNAAILGDWLRRQLAFGIERGHMKLIGSIFWLGQRSRARRVGIQG